jgi:hypothetical protein
MAEVLAQSGASAAPPAALVISTIKAATQFAAGGATASAVSAQAAALTEGMLKAIWLSKLKMATVLVLAAGKATGSAGTLAYYGTTTRQSPAAPGQVSRHGPAASPRPAGAVARAVAPSVVPCPRGDEPLAARFAWARE